MSHINILGLSGSHREGSFNTALLANAVSLTPEGVTLTIYEGLEKLPFYLDTLDGINLHPEAERFREAVTKSDGILIASPEHNFSVSAILKNALDWGSRPSGAHGFIGKPTAILGASGGLLGTIRAQLHARDILHSLQADVIARPEVLVTLAAKKFDSNGNLIDEQTKQLIRDLLEALVAKIKCSQTRQKAS